MYSPDPSFDGENLRIGAAGPLILGVPWPAPPGLVQAAANLAAALELRLVCAFVDPASYLIEWESARTRLAASLDPAVNDEAMYPAAELRGQLEDILGPPGAAWSFRVLNGDVGRALCRLAESTGASMFIVGGGRDGLLARLTRVLEGSVAASLTRLQHRAVVVVPEHVHKPRDGATRHRASA